MFVPCVCCVLCVRRAGHSFTGVPPVRFWLCTTKKKKKSKRRIRRPDEKKFLETIAVYITAWSRFMIFTSGQALLGRQREEMDGPGMEDAWEKCVGV